MYWIVILSTLNQTVKLRLISRVKWHFTSKQCKIQDAQRPLISRFPKVSLPHYEFWRHVVRSPTSEGDFPIISIIDLGTEPEIDDFY